MLLSLTNTSKEAVTCLIEREEYRTPNGRSSKNDGKRLEDERDEREREREI